MDDLIKNLRLAARRVRSLGWSFLVPHQREVVWRILKTALAASLAWALAEALLDAPIPVLAPLAAIIVVQVTIYQTIRRSIEYSAGVLAGLLVAFLLGRLFGLHAWSIGVMMALSLAAGNVMRLGRQSIQVAITALLVMTLGTQYGLARFLDSLLGAVIGIVVNVLVVPPLRTRPAAEAVASLASAIASVLEEMASGVAHGWQSTDADRWLETARRLSEPLHRARDLLVEAEESLRFNPRTWHPPEPPRGVRLARRITDRWLAHEPRMSRREALRALEHAVLQSRGLARSLRNAAGQLDEADGQALSEVLAKAADLFALFARIQTAGEPDLRDRLEQQAGEAIESAHALTHSEWLSRPGPPEELVLKGALLEDLNRLVSEVSPEGPHAAAIPP